MTTYTYTTSTSDVDTVSATDDERLPPGGFSLRHGFPQWFGRSKDRTAGSGIFVADSATSQPRTAASAPNMYEVLEYLRSAFTDEAFLDSVPLQAAANSGAYHAWKTHRAREPGGDEMESQVQPFDGRARSPLSLSSRSGTPTTGRRRRPGEWNWEGVWEERVKRGVQNSLAEPSLFGAAVGGDDIIRFSDLEPDDVQRIKEQMV
ncbi:putative ubiquitin carboxyl-terminal hydrolase [Venturia nashicola]|uniref:Putative ubiquitin carboxyl-terminal hydrolase n=1 Tax=Venturia nashicola TaxID=86259 RepID=A0A4Z1P481_9PEZI|nr:putative ubiquitin carboxyl-terminal hydrolase [Venturia nashicola]TLD24621.1 putative ubiquitin carboxyl-terminal hydrolase [Venturia nashicola]